MCAGDEKDLRRSMTQLKQTTQQEKGKTQHLEKERGHKPYCSSELIRRPIYSNHASNRSPKLG